MMTPRFTFVDLERANWDWGANCGPGAFAAVLGQTLDEAKPHFMPAFPGYTNPTRMFNALRSAGRRWSSIGVPRASRTTWPIWGLCRIQWEGPWTQPGMPPRWAYRFTHWTGSCTDQHRGVGVFDINALENGSGWCSLEDWSAHLAPALARNHDKRATGEWHITHAIEVARR